MIASFLILKVLRLDTQGEIHKLGNTAGWSKLDLFAWHFFEHSLDYVYTAALVAFIYLMTLKLEMRRHLP